MEKMLAEAPVVSPLPDFKEGLGTLARGITAPAGDPIPPGQWFEAFNELAGDLYPGRYTRAFCDLLVQQANRALELATQKGSMIVAHYYQYPELQELALLSGGVVQDSLGLAQWSARLRPRRLDFCGVRFMGETAAILADGQTRVFMPDPENALCSLTLDTTRQLRFIANFRHHYPQAVFITYINSDPRVKAECDFVCTSRNAQGVFEYVVEHYPGTPVCFLPDQHLGRVILWQLRGRIDPALVTVYPGECYIHAAMDAEALRTTIQTHPRAQILVHPECGCASSCLVKLETGEVSGADYHFLSTQGMVKTARESEEEEFVIATEKGMLYSLRRAVPGKTFYPVVSAEHCQYMKKNTVEKLLESLRQDTGRVQVPEDIAQKARHAIERMLAIA